MSSKIFFSMIPLRSFKPQIFVTLPHRAWSTCSILGNKVNQKSTIDKSDIELHSKLKNDWWCENGSIKALHSMNALRVPLVRNGLVNEKVKSLSPLKGKKILDVGCGGGILAEGLAKLGASVTGIDAAKELIEVAQLHSQENERLQIKPEYVFTSAEDHAKTRPNYYDGVVASEIIEHVNNKELFVKSCVDTLKPGGKIFFTTPNRTRIAQITGIYISEYVLRLIPKGTHQYEKFITPNELSFMLERNNCHVDLIHGMFYHVWSNRWQWVQFQHFMYALQATKEDCI